MLEAIWSRAKMLVLIVLFFLPVVAAWYSKRVDDQWRTIITLRGADPQPQIVADVH